MGKRIALMLMSVIALGGVGLGVCSLGYPQMCPGLGSWLDFLLLRVHADPAAPARYEWPGDVAFTAPFDLVHIENYPAYVRLGARGTVDWRGGQLSVRLTQISHARQRNLDFDCDEIRELRVGLTTIGPFDSYSPGAPDGVWSAWQVTSAKRQVAQPLRAPGNWTFTVDTSTSTLPWTQRIAVQARCKVSDGSIRTLLRLSPAWFLARAAHLQARAPDPCAYPLRLREAIAAQCTESVILRLATPWGRREIDRAPYEDATWLDVAIAEGLSQALRPLVRAGVAVDDTRGETRETALIYAAGNGDADAVRELLMLGARKDLTDAKGFTAYNAAAVSGFGDLALELAERGVERDTNTGSAYTALSLAAYYGQTNTVRRLLESGSDPDKQINGWYNALHHAVKQNNLKLARVMLGGGADPNARVTARRGETPLMMAAENDNTEMMALLRMMGRALKTRIRKARTHLTMRSISISHRLLPTYAKPDFSAMFASPVEAVK